MAESIFRQKVKDANLEDSIYIDSAGTGDWHVGDNPDPRAIKVLLDNGIGHYSLARQVHTDDFKNFDYIVAMDLSNVNDLKRWSGAQLDKISLMLNWGEFKSGEIVPDPYYGHHEDFVAVYELLDRSTDELLSKLIKIHNLDRTQSGS